MSAQIGIVVDSTAQLSGEQLERAQAATGGLVRVVDLFVSVDGQERPDSEWSAEDICQAMLSGAGVTTSLAPADSFASAYRELAAQGASGILVLTMSAALSGTHQAAAEAASTAPVPVEVVDSRLTSAGLAGAVEMAIAGLDSPLTTLAGIIRDWCEQACRIFFVPADLEYLRRGGRIGAASTLIGKALAIVPVLSLREGTVHPIARVRTRSKAVDRLAALVATTVDELTEFDPGEDIAIVLLHPEASVDKAGPILKELEAALGDTAAGPYAALNTIAATAVLPSVITAHVGPGAVGVAVFTRPRV